MSNYVLQDGELRHTDDELYHYGVLGMKWGVHRAKQKGTTYRYESHDSKSYKRRAEKAYAKGDKDKGDKYKQYEKRSRELDRKMQENGTKSGVGKTAAKVWLINNTRTYEATKAALGSGGVVARGAAYLNSYLFGGLGATPVRALYVRGYDGKWLAGETKKELKNFGR